MQKKLIALAVAGVLAAPMAAQAASAEVYGKVRVSAGIVGNDDTAVGNDDSKISVTSHKSRFGVKGSEDLGDGLKAVYQFESQVDFDDDNNGLFDGMRNTYVGLSGDFGMVLLGKHDTPYKLTKGKLDVWSDTHADYNAIMSDTHDARADNVIAYVSPDMNGLTFAGAYVTDLHDDNLADSTFYNVDGSVDGDGNPTHTAGDLEQSNEAISLGVMYNSGPLYAGFGYQTLAEAGVPTSAENEDAEGTKFSLGYKVGTTMLGFAYEIDDWGGDNNDQNRMFFSVNHGMGDGLNIKFAYTMADDRGDTKDSGATHFALGVTKKVGDTTELYALYTQLDNDANASFDLDYVDSAGSPESSASAAVVGVNMKFSSM